MEKMEPRRANQTNEMFGYFASQLVYFFMKCFVIRWHWLGVETFPSSLSPACDPVEEVDGQGETSSKPF